MLDLLAVKKQIQVEEVQLISVQAQIMTARTDLDVAQLELKSIQQQILGAEDSVQLESFALYEPKYQFTNSPADYSLLR